MFIGTNFKQRGSKMRKFGLVLGGGGSKGAYEMGVWKALCELGIEIDIVTGTSIGALNGALVAQKDYDKAMDVWNNLNYEAVLSNVKNVEFTTVEGAKKLVKNALREIVVDGGMDTQPLEKLIYENIDEQKLRSSDIKLGIVTVELPAMKVAELTCDMIAEGEVCEYLLASAAIYPAFKRREIGGNMFIDGGYRNNLPVDFAASLGAEDILAVDLDSIGLVPRRKRTDVNVTVLKSYWSLGNFLVFEQNLIQKNIKLGYNDTLKLFGKLEGYGYTFEPGETQKYLENYWPKLEALLDKMGIELSSQKIGVELAVASRINQLLVDPKRMGRNPNCKQLRALEIAAESHLIDGEVVYTIEELNAALKAAATQPQMEEEIKIKKILENPSKSGELILKLTNAEYRQFVAFILRTIKQADESGNYAPALALAALFAKEFLAACYLYILEV